MTKTFGKYGLNMFMVWNRKLTKTHFKHLNECVWWDKLVKIQFIKSDRMNLAI